MKPFALLLFCAVLLPAPTWQARPPASPTDEVAIPIVDEAVSRVFCSPRWEPGPIVDQESFKKLREAECFSFLKKLDVDFSKHSLIAYRIRGDCMVHGSIKITRNDTLKKYTFVVTKYYGGCRAAGSSQGIVVIEKLRPDYAIENVEKEGQQGRGLGL